MTQASRIDAELLLEPPVLVKHFRGAIDDDVLLGYYTHLVPGSYATHSLLLDFTEVTSFDVSASAIHRLADWARSAHMTRHRAAVLAIQPHVYGMCRIYQALTEGSVAEVRVFSNREEALGWLAGALPI